MKQLMQGGRLFVLLTVLTGLIYPLSITCLAQWFFPWQANGSLLIKDGRTVGSYWIGQYFSANQYFWGRPSATAGFPYNPLASGALNAGPTNPQYVSIIQERASGWQRPIPVDLVTASASGLDPDISPEAAYYQAARIADARHLPLVAVQQLIQAQMQSRELRILGEPRVNVLSLNLALDNL